MNFNFTQDKLQQCLSNNREIDQWFPLLEGYLEFYEINTVERVAAFLSQTGHESLNFTATHENLNYGAPGLMTTFKKYFPTQELADAYARQPEKIANRVYANRMGNGDEASGDGWKYRGRGIIQLTGHDNYKACSLAVFQDERLLEDPNWLESKEGCVVGACWFWNTRFINKAADAEDTDAVTRLVNGGLNGIDDRRARYASYKEILSAD
jgi:putative chitinase